MLSGRQPAKELTPGPGVKLPLTPPLAAGAPPSTVSQASLHCPRDSELKSCNSHVPRSHCYLPAPGQSAQPYTQWAPRCAGHQVCGGPAGAGQQESAGGDEHSKASLLDSTPCPLLTSYAYRDMWLPISGPVSSSVRWGQSSLPLLVTQRACLSRCCHSRTAMPGCGGTCDGEAGPEGREGSPRPPREPRTLLKGSGGQWPKARGAGPHRDPPHPACR